MPNFIDMTGLKCGELTVLHRVDGKDGRTTWLCKCSCGNDKVARGQYLRDGRTTSCGCVQKEGARRRLLKHGRSYKDKDGSYEYQRESHLLRKYGINLDVQNMLLVKQENKCWICKYEFGQESGDTYVDHCHSTGVVRGLLCRKCNSGIGQFNDDKNLLSAAIEYLSNVNDFIVPTHSKPSYELEI